MRLAAIASAFVLVLTGCGGSVVPDQAADRVSKPEATTAVDVPGKPAPPKFFFTGERTAVSAGVREIKAVCGDVAGPGQWLFDFLVPAAWVETGKGNSGGGSTGSSGAGDVSHEMPDGNKVRIVVKQDNRLHTGELVGDDEKPVAEDNFDYSFERAVGDEPMRVIQVVYKKLDPVTIDGQSVPFASMDQKESELDESEFTARLRYADMPASPNSNERRNWSATVKISWDSEKGSFDEAVARSILTSMRFGQCAQDSGLDYLGLMGMTEFAE